MLFFSVDANTGGRWIFNKKQTSLEACPDSVYYVWWGWCMTNASTIVIYKHSILTSLSVWIPIENPCFVDYEHCWNFHKCVISAKNPQNCWDFVNSSNYCYIFPHFSRNLYKCQTSKYWCWTLSVTNSLLGDAIAQVLLPWNFYLQIRCKKLKLLLLLFRRVQFH